MRVLIPAPLAASARPQRELLSLEVSNHSDVIAAEK